MQGNYTYSEPNTKLYLFSAKICAGPKENWRFQANSSIKFSKECSPSLLSPHAFPLQSELQLYLNKHSNIFIGVRYFNPISFFSSMKCWGYTVIFASTLSVDESAYFHKGWRLSSRSTVLLFSGLFEVLTFLSLFTVSIAESVLHLWYAVHCLFCETANKIQQAK